VLRASQRAHNGSSGPVQASKGAGHTGIVNSGQTGASSGGLLSEAMERG